MRSPEARHPYRLTKRLGLDVMVEGFRSNGGRGLVRMYGSAARN